MMKFFQKLGKSLMLPVAVLPICGLMMGVGYFLCPASMQGGSVSGLGNIIGLFLVKAGSAAIDNIAILFAIGVGAGLSDNNDGTGCLAAILSWLIIVTLLNTDFVTIIMPSIKDNADSIIAFNKIANPFIGIIAGLIGSGCYNKFKSTKLPDWLSFFSGKRFVSIAAGVISVLASVVLLFVWPSLFNILIWVGNSISSMGAFGAGIYAFLNRLLIPIGLHHALNNVFWFDTVGIGDLTHFWAGDTSADVGWSLGMYMSGFFPCMMFGVPGAALAIARCAKPEKKKVVAGIMLSSAICAFVCGVTEPFEFSFMFLAPGLYVAYALLYGIFTYITCLAGFRAGFSFSGGITDLIFSSSLPAAAKIWLIIPLGLAAFAMFYFVFYFAITKWNLKTPGREEDKIIEPNRLRGDDNFKNMAEAVIDGLGGKENINSIDNCATRLRIEIKDIVKVNDEKIKSSGILAVLHTGNNSLQAVVGTKVQFLADEIKKQIRFAVKDSDAANVPNGVTPEDEANKENTDAAAAAENAMHAIGNSASVNENHRKVKHGEAVNFGFDSSAQFEYVIKDPVGIHARPAGELAKFVNGLGCNVVFKNGEKTASGKSVLELMMLGACCGSRLEICVTGPGAKQSMQQLKKFMEERM